MNCYCGPVQPQTISSASDPRLRPFRDLQGRRDESEFVVESGFAVERLLSSGWPVATVVTTPNRVAKLAPMVASPTQFLVAPRPLLREVLGFDFHRGVLAAAPRPDWPRVDWRTQCAQASSIVLAVNGVSDPANIGSLIRTARAFGCNHILLDKGCADPLSRRAIRASMGHVFHQPIALVDDLRQEIRRSTRHGTRWWASTPDPTAAPLKHARTHRPSHLVLLVGHEGFGVEPQLLQLADFQVTIRMAQAIDSLGVAAATAAMLYVLHDIAGNDPPTG